MSNVIDELYRKVSAVADQLEEELGRPVSMNEALLRLVESMKLDPSDLSWSWRISGTGETEKEAD